MFSHADDIVLPGDPIDAPPSSLFGRGTSTSAGGLSATLAGVVTHVNALVSVTPLASRYSGEVGDVVVGRVTEVGHKRWAVDLGGRTAAHLLLSAVNLAGGLQRRRTYDDALAMREVLGEGDLVACEVQSVRSDGAPLLQARSARFGQLGGGALVRVPCGSVVRSPSHFVTLDCGVDVILGMNGVVFIAEAVGGGSRPGGRRRTGSPWAGCLTPCPPWQLPAPR